MKTLQLASVFVAVLTVTPATAAEFDVRVDITSGALTGETFSGDFSYDDSQVVGVSEEFVDLTSLSFMFLGVDYGLNDGLGEAAFFDGDFLGLSYSVDAPGVAFFSFVPGFIDVDEAFFSYEDPNGDGEGSAAFSLARVPVPASLLLLVTGLIGLFRFR